MKSIFALLLIFAVAGCEKAAVTTTGKPTVVATTTMIGDLVRRIAGDRVDLIVMMPSGVDPHSFKPSTQDMANVARATLVLYNGLHLEGKMVDLMERELEQRAIAVTRDIHEDRLLAWAAGSGGTHDPHVWFDPTIWASAAKTAAGELARIDPAGAAEYQKNGDAAAAELLALHEELKTKLAAIPQDRRVLITSHDAFSYFGRIYDVDVRGLQGISTETQAGLSNIKAAVDFIVERKIPAVFVESSVPHSTIERVQADCKSRGFDVKIGGELYSDAMGSPGEHPGYAVETYEGMMRYNVDLIVKALK